MSGVGPQIYWNGWIGPADAVHLSPYDRGFMLGDGLFETIRVYAGRPFRLAAHLDRLAAGSVVLALALPGGLAAAVQEVIAANGWQEAAVRLTVSRGVAPPEHSGLLPDPALPPTVVITGRLLGSEGAGAPPYPAAWYERGIGLATGGPRRNEHSPVSGCKTLNYLDQVLLRQAAARAGAEEGLQQNTAGAVVGASVANVFLIRAGQVATPDRAAGPLPGVTRAAVCALASRLGYTVVETILTPADVQAADEVFLTNSLMEVLPAVRLDGAPLGTGRPGPVTAALATALRDLCRSEG